MLRVFLLFSILFLATACARPGVSTLRVVPAAKGAKEISVLVASDRMPDRNDNGFSSAKSFRLRFREVIVSVPPTHKATEIEWPKGKPNAANSFAIIKSRELTAQEFVMMAQRVKQRPPLAPGIGVFVHGYNYSYQEALFRLVQLSIDSGETQSSVLFDWPSEGTLTGYIHDRDAVAFARDDLVEVLRQLGGPGLFSSRNFPGDFCFAA